MDNRNMNSKNKFQLHKDHWRKNSPEFQYFIKRIIGALSPKEIDFKRKSFQITLSNIFTPSDDTFALLFLYNDYDLWLNTTKGMRYILNEVEKRRKEQQSKDLEIELLKMYQQQNGKHTTQDDEDNTSEKEQRQKDQCDMIETLSKDDEDYKFHIEYMERLQK
eukprot:jgi/Psemu1/32421/gm1.32421_g